MSQQQFFDRLVNAPKLPLFNFTLLELYELADEDPGLESAVNAFLFKLTHQQLLDSLVFLVNRLFSSGSTTSLIVLQSLTKYCYNLGLRVKMLTRQSGSCSPGAEKAQSTNSFLMQATYQKIENAMINGVEPSPNQHQIQVVESFSRLKYLRSEAANKSLKFYSFLAMCSIKLLEYPRGQTNVRLSQMMLKANHLISEGRCDFFKGGLIFPFEENNNQQTRVIGNIIIQQFQIFFTKTKVPYRVVFETFLEQEFELSGIQLERDETVTQIFDVYDYKKQMDDLAHNKYNRACNISIIKEAKIYRPPSGSVVKPAKGYFGQSLDVFLKRVIQNSSFGSLKSYRLDAFIVKGGDDLRQQALIMGVIKCMQNIFFLQKTKCWLRPYEIFTYSESSGFIEYLWQSLSIDSLKKAASNSSLKTIFIQQFTVDFDKAQINFAQSLAGYSLACYILALKDRHNGNILVDKQGHLIHIDYGFVLGCSPGNNRGFESAPFKFTNQYVELLDGKGSHLYKYFCDLVGQGLRSLSKHSSLLLSLITSIGKNQELPCSKQLQIEQVRQRLQVGQWESGAEQRAVQLIEESLNNSNTHYYDVFQYLTNNIFY